MNSDRDFFPPPRPLTAPPPDAPTMVDVVRHLTGNCEIDCRVACAYPGEFSECGMDVPA